MQVEGFKAGQAVGVVASGVRTALGKYRSGVTAPDLIATPAAPALGVGAAVGTLANVAYNVSLSAFNLLGDTVASANATATPAAGVAIRVTPAAVITGGLGFDVALSTGGNPLGVGRITAAQVAAGGYVCISIAAGFVAGGAAPAGSFDVGVVGTGPANNVVPFLYGNAYNPAAVAAGALISGNLAGYSRAYLKVKVTLSNLVGPLPTLNLVMFTQNLVSLEWGNGMLLMVPLLAGSGQTLERDVLWDVSGANCAWLVDTITGNGASVDLWLEAS